MKKLITKAYYNPAVVFLLTIVYGLLKIDFGNDNEKAAYGWLYIFFGIWICLVLYAIAAVRVLRYVVRELRSNRGLFNHLHCLLVVFTLTSFVSFLYSPFDNSFGLYSLSTYSGVVFAISVVGLAVTGELLSHYTGVKTKKK